MTDSERYSARGVSSTKDEVHGAIERLDKGLFEMAFCKILPDIAAGDPAYCNVLHADTAGTKASLAYLYWKETGDTSVWRGIAQDAIVMNVDDMACVGCVDHFLLSNTITRNKHRIPGEVLNAIIQGTIDFTERMAEHGIEIVNAGGETADVGDIVRTVDVGFTAFGRLKRDNLVINNIQHGDHIVGLSSSGQSTYETGYNSGIGSNGLTSARHDVLDAVYAARYPESYSPETPATYIYSGKKLLTDGIDGDEHGMTVGQLLLSPTRTYLPFMRVLFAELPGEVHGVIHCTGGGQTKVSKFLPMHLTTIKDNLLVPPPVFRMIQEESGTAWKEMYQVFNMGVRLEVYVPEYAVEHVIAIARAFGIESQVIGHVEERTAAAVTLQTEYGTFNYGAK